MSAPPPRTAWAKAIDEFITELQNKSDKNTEFYKQVLAQIDSGSFKNGSLQDSRSWADSLAQTVDEVKARHLAPTKSHRIADGLGAFVTTFNEYAVAFDAMLQAGPAAAQLLYGGARVVLLLAQKVVDCYDTVLVILDDISYNIRCYHKYAVAYETNADVQDLLVKSYKAIVNFWLRASRLLTTRAIKVIISRNSQLSKEWQKYRVELQKWRERVDSETRAADALSRKMDEERNAIKAAEDTRKTLMNKTVEWIRAGEDSDALDFRATVREKESSRHPTTCEWIFDEPEYKTWINAKKNATLWLRNSAGTGKTIMAATVVKALEQQNLKVACYFFSFSDLVQRKSVTALRSIAVQLLSMYEKERKSIPDTVQKLLDADLANHCEKLADREVAIDVVKGLLKQVGRVHIVVDGLDECEDRSAMLQMLSAFSQMSSYGIVKWFFTSRPEKDIGDNLRRAQIVEVDPPLPCILADVRKFMADKLEQEIGMECNSCVDKWIDKSDGNFLFAQSTLRTLKGDDFVCEEELDEALRSFPIGLKGYYERTLQQIVLIKPPAQVELARSIFALLVASVQPLRLSEMAQALAAARSPNDSDFNPRRVPKLEMIESLCSGLVTFDAKGTGGPDDPLLKFGHKSIRDFFVEDPTRLSVSENIRSFFTTEEEASMRLGHACLKYLSYSRYTEPVPDIKLLVEEPEHSFLRHAASFWHFYMDQGGKGEGGVQSVINFVRSPMFWNCVAVQLHTVPHMFARFYQYADGFRIHSEKDNHQEYSARVHYGSPLPQWLDDHSAEASSLVGHIQRFITRWHPVLNTHPNALSECVMDDQWLVEMPHIRPFLNPRVSSWTLYVKDSRTHVSIVDVEGGESDRSITCETTIYDPQDNESAISVHGWDINVCSSRISRHRKALVPLLDHATEALRRARLTNDKRSEHFFLSVEGLARQINEAKTSDDAGVDEGNMVTPSLTWYTVDQFTSPRPGGGNMLFAVSFSNKESITEGGEWEHWTSTGLSEEDATSVSANDSGYDESSETDATSVSANDSGYDDGEPSPIIEQKPEFNRCMIICENPFGRPISSLSNVGTPGFETGCAINLPRKLAIWSEQSFELCVADLTTSHISRIPLPEPSCLILSTPHIQRKDFHFSPCGDLLHYISYTASKTEVGFTQDLTLSTFGLSDPSSQTDPTNVTLTKNVADRCLSLSSISTLRSPFALSTWTSTHAYMALPNLCSTPLLLRIDLTDPDAPWQTLVDPVFFPSDAAFRSPKLYILPTTDGYERLVLTLDAAAVATPPGADSTVSTTLVMHGDGITTTRAEADAVAAAPLLLTWRLGAHAWRAWEAEKDGASAEYLAAQDAHVRLRGGFVDAAQRFNVPIRSGLDWTRKAVVSCA